MILDRRFSAAEVASLTQVSAPTLTFYIRKGVLTPSLQRAAGRGQGNVFDVADVVGLLTMNSLRLPNAEAPPLRKLVAFWRSERGRILIREIITDRHSDERIRLLVLTEHGVDVDADPVSVMAKRKVGVAYCLDVSRIITDLFIQFTEHVMVQAFPEPGPAGRATAKKRPVRKPSVSKRTSGGPQEEPRRRKKRTVSR